MLIYDAVCAAICLVCVILSIVGLFTETGETELLRHKYNLGESLGAVALIIAVALIRRKLFNFPRVVEIVVVFLILAGMVLGDCWDLYGIITFWDSILHALFCFLVGYFAIYVFNLMNREQIKKVLTSALRRSPFSPSARRLPSAQSGNLANTLTTTSTSETAKSSTRSNSTKPQPEPIRPQTTSLTKDTLRFATP